MFHVWGAGGLCWLGFAWHCRAAVARSVLYMATEGRCVLRCQGGRLDAYLGCTSLFLKDHPLCQQLLPCLGKPGAASRREKRKHRDWCHLSEGRGRKEQCSMHQGQQHSSVPRPPSAHAGCTRPPPQWLAGPCQGWAQSRKLSQRASVYMHDLHTRQSPMRMQNNMHVQPRPHLSPAVARKGAALTGPTESPRLTAAPRPASASLDAQLLLLSLDWLLAWQATGPLLVARTLAGWLSTAGALTGTLWDRLDCKSAIPVNVCIEERIR